MDKTTEGTTQVFTVNTTTPEIEQVSIVAGDGITVTHSSNTYTISATISGITYDFDPSWFTVTNNNVTINEAKLDTLVNEAINELGVEVTGEGLVESTFRGNLYANTQGTLTLNTEVSY